MSVLGFPNTRKTQKNTTVTNVTLKSPTVGTKALYPSFSL